MYTNSVAIAYRFPLRGLEGAGEGGKSWPSKSTLENAFPKDFTGPEDVDSELPLGEYGGDFDILGIRIQSRKRCNEGFFSNPK